MNATSSDNTPPAYGTSTHSQGDHELHDFGAVQKVGNGFKKYLLQYTTSRTKVRLYLGWAASPAVYYVETSLLSPHVMLRRGDQQTSPMVSFAKLTFSLRNASLATGDYYKQSENQISWEELRRDKNIFLRSDYHFGTAEGSATGKRVEFVWRKNMDKTFTTVYDLVDQDGRMIGRLLSGGALNWKKGGEIEILEGMHQGLEEFLLISALAIWTGEALGYQSIFKGYGDSDKNHKED